MNYLLVIIGVILAIPVGCLIGELIIWFFEGKQEMGCHLVRSSEVQKVREEIERRKVKK